MTRPADDAGLDDWTDGYRGLAERMHEVWVLSGRPDPFDHDMEAWRGFALAVRAATRPAEDAEAVADANGDELEHGEPGQEAPA